MFRRIGYGVIVWTVCYVTAIVLMDLMVSDRPAFQTIMLLEGALVGSVLACLYFRDVNAGFCARASFSEWCGSSPIGCSTSSRCCPSPPTSRCGGISSKSASAPTDASHG